MRNEQDVLNPRIYVWKEFGAEICGGIYMDVTVKTNCPRGGDAGHGGLTTVTFRTPNCLTFGHVISDIETDDLRDREEISIVVGGDFEAEVLAKALKWAGENLELLLSCKPSLPEPA